MRLPLRVLLCFTVVGAAAASCSLFTNLDGYSGGSVTPEASAGEASIMDAAGDRSAASDASTDARFCATVTGSPIFCEDFDDSALGVAWVPRVDDGAAMGLDDASSTSSPNALRTTMASVPPTAPCAYAYANRTLASPFAQRLRVECDLRIGHVGDPGGFPASGFATTGLTVKGKTGKGSCAYYFVVTPSSASLVVEPDNNPTKTYELSRSFVQGTWTHVALVFDTSAANAPTVTVSLDGVTALDKQQLTPTGCGFGSMAEMTPGLFCVGDEATDIDVRTDNVAVWTD